MTAFIGIVEDNPSYIKMFQRKFKDQAIIASSLQEFKEKLLPRTSQIKIWFLDIQVPKIKGGDPMPKYGFEVAEYLKKHHKATPRYCISLSHFPEKLFTDKIQKGSLREMNKKINEVLQK